MGRRDFRRREPKKPRKDNKKIAAATVLSSPTVVEVIKRGKEKRGRERE